MVRKLSFWRSASKEVWKVLAMTRNALTYYNFEFNCVIFLRWRVRYHIMESFKLALFVARRIQKFQIFMFYRCPIWILNFQIFSCWSPSLLNRKYLKSISLFGKVLVFETSIVTQHDRQNLFALFWLWHYLHRVLPYSLLIEMYE